MYNHLVMTSGVSLFSSMNKIGAFVRSICEEHGMYFENSNPKMKEGCDEEESIRNICAKVEDYLLEMNLAAVWKKVSAEYSMIAALEGQMEENSVVDLFYTNTLGGKLAAICLKSVIKHGYSYEVSIHRIQNLDVFNRIKMNEALGTFMKDLSGVLASCYTPKTVFAPIGGYKVMTSLGYIVGSFHGYETLYVNEEAQVLHRIPPVPIDIQETFFNENQQLLRKLRISGLIQFDDLSAAEKKIVKLYTTIFEEVDGLVGMNPFGQFLFERSQYIAKLHTKVYFSKQVVKELERHRTYQKVIYNDLHSLRRKVIDDNRHQYADLYHERAYPTVNPSLCEFHLFRGKNENPNIRLTWKYEEEDDELFINRMWIDNHDVYVKEIRDDQRGLLKSEGQWQDYSEEFHKSYMKGRIGNA